MLLFTRAVLFTLITRSEENGLSLAIRGRYGACFQTTYTIRHRLISLLIQIFTSPLCLFHVFSSPFSQHDAIDVEVARHLAAQPVRIKCKRLEAGVYWINKCLKAYVRLIRDRLLVRVGGGWEDFAAFVKHHESAAFAPLVVYAQLM